MGFSENNSFLLGIESFETKKDWNIFDSLNELAELADTAGLVVVGRLTQKRDSPHTSFYLGSGKLQEVKNLLTQQEINVLITDDELTPRQQKAMEKFFEGKIKVIDRTGLILDIFASHARTYEAQLQVELAQLEYLLPRLTRMWTHLSRLGGGIGTRGPGEKQLEVDKRQIRTRITAVQKALDKVKKHRLLYRKKRESLPIITASLIGYTNAGKSTLMNRLTQADVLVEDQLFATLDPTTRKLKLKNNDTILLSDTVGFIQKLPHQLVKSFHSTLEEVIYSDFLLLVTDVSHPKYMTFLQTSMEIVKEIKADNKYIIYVFNKLDKVHDLKQLKLEIKKKYQNQNYIFISAKNGDNCDELLDLIADVMEKYKNEIIFRIPYNKMEILNLLYEYGDVKEVLYEKDIKAIVNINKIIGNKILGLFGK